MAKNGQENAKDQAFILTMATQNAQNMNSKRMHEKLPNFAIIQKLIIPLSNWKVMHYEYMVCINNHFNEHVQGKMYLALYEPQQSVICTKTIPLESETSLLVE